MTSEDFAARIEDMMQTLHRVCYALLPCAPDREDAVQAALLRAFEKLYTLREDRFFQTWVVRILINECRAIVRSRRGEIPVERVPEREAPAGADPAVHDALLALPAQLRLPVVLHYMQGYPVSEIAKMLKIPQGTVKSRMRKAREALRNCLEEGEEVAPCEMRI